MFFSSPRSACHIRSTVDAKHSFPLLRSWSEAATDDGRTRQYSFLINAKSPLPPLLKAAIGRGRLHPGRFSCYIVDDKWERRSISLFPCRAFLQDSCFLSLALNLRSCFSLSFITKLAAGKRRAQTDFFLTICTSRLPGSLVFVEEPQLATKYPMFFLDLWQSPEFFPLGL